MTGAHSAASMNVRSPWSDDQGLSEEPGESFDSFASPGSSLFLGLAFPDDNSHAI